MKNHQKPNFGLKNLNLFCRINAPVHHCANLLILLIYSVIHIGLNLMISSKIILFSSKRCLLVACGFTSTRLVVAVSLHILHRKMLNQQPKYIKWLRVFTLRKCFFRAESCTQTCLKTYQSNTYFEKRCFL